MHRRKTLAVLGAAPLVFAPWRVYCQTVTRVLVGAPPGGGTDIVARTLAQEMSQRMARQLVVDNRPGAGGNLAAAAVAKAPPDGNTLLLSYTSHVINPALYGSELPFDAVEDFTPLAGIASLPAILVAHPALPVDDIGDLIAYGKSHPGELNIAIAGLGGANHLAGEVLKRDTGMDIVSVPYKGTAPALQDVIAGQIQLVIAGVASVQAHIRAGKVKALGVTSAKRIAGFAQIPAIAEVLPGFDFSSWYGLFGPAGMDGDLAEQFSQAARAALTTTTLRQRFDSQGLIVMGSDRATFANFVRSEIRRWGEVVAATGTKPA